MQPLNQMQPDHRIGIRVHGLAGSDATELRTSWISIEFGDFADPL